MVSLDFCIKIRIGSARFLLGQPTPDTFIRSLELCQVLVSHFVTLTEDSAAPGSHNSRIEIQTLEEIFSIMEESMEKIDTVATEGVENVGEDDCIKIRTEEDSVIPRLTSDPANEFFG